MKTVKKHRENEGRAHEPCIFTWRYAFWGSHLQNYWVLLSYECVFYMHFCDGSETRIIHCKNCCFSKIENNSLWKLLFLEINFICIVNMHSKLWNSVFCMRVPTTPLPLCDACAQKWSQLDTHRLPHETVRDGIRCSFPCINWCI